MSGVVTEPADVSAHRRRYRVAARIGAFVALGLGLGAAAGVLWELVVDLPVYKIASDGAASTTERGLTEFFGGDAWFVAIGLLVGSGSGHPRLATVSRSGLAAGAGGLPHGPRGRTAVLDGGLPARTRGFHPAAGRGSGRRPGPDRVDPEGSRLAAGLAVLRGHPGPARLVPGPRRRGPPAVLSPSDPGVRRSADRRTNPPRAQCPMGANFPPVTRARSAGASSTWRPRFPAETMIVSKPVADWSMTVRSGVRWPMAEMPPTT